MVLRHRLKWLGHVALMDGNRLPKQLLFLGLAKQGQLMALSSVGDMYVKTLNPLDFTPVGMS